jgi:hypothetical protein
MDLGFGEELKEILILESGEKVELMAMEFILGLTATDMRGSFKIV